MIRKEQTSSVLVRLPHKVKAWIEDEAAKNCSSQNSEIVRCIVARMEQAGAVKAKNQLDALIAITDPSRA